MAGAGLPLYSFQGERHRSVVYHGGDGLFYHIVNRREDRRFVYMRCMHYDRVGDRCFGTAKALFGANLLFPMQPHNHDGNVWHPSALRLREAIVQRVRNGDQNSFPDIVQQEGQRFTLDVRRQVPLSTLEAHLNRIRSNLLPPTPRSLGVLGAALLLPQYQYMTRCLHVDDSMYAGMCGSMPDQTLSLVFISPEMKGFMGSRHMVFGDGTERKKFSRPKCSQVYSVVGSWRHHVIPMMRALMLRRTTEAYVTLLRFMKALMPNFRPRSIKCDFEDAQINAWRRIYPRATVEGCLWHYAVAVFRHASKLGLSELIRTESEVASIVRSLSALPLLPTEDIEDGLLELGWEARDKGWMRELKPLFQYMEMEWLPKVPILSVKGSMHRTNNISESANRTFNRVVRISRPNCFQVIRAFVVCNDRAITDLRILLSGLSPGRRRKLSALRNDVRIRNLTADYENEDISLLEFLHRASRRMQGVFNKMFR